MGSCLQLFAVLLISIGCAQFGNAQNAAVEDCENMDFTNVTSTTRAEFNCNDQVFIRDQKCMAAYDCCARNHKNLHCRFACHMRHKKILKKNGLWDRRKFIRMVFHDFGLARGTDIAIDMLECLDRFGSYKETSTCTSIEKHMACFASVYQRECGVKTGLFMNSHSFSESNLDCNGTTYHWPTLYLESSEECAKTTNATYMHDVCVWKSIGLLNEDGSLNPEGQSNWAKILLGKVTGQTWIKKLRESVAGFDAQKMFSSANEDNAVEVLGDYMAAAKQAFFEVCGTATYDFVNTV